MRVRRYLPAQDTHVNVAHAIAFLRLRRSLQAKCGYIVRPEACRESGSGPSLCAQGLIDEAFQREAVVASELLARHLLKAQ